MISLIRIFYAPFFFIGFISAAVWLVGSDLPVLTLLALLLGAVIISLLAERIAPYEPIWNRDHNDRTRDVIHALVNEASIVGMLLLLPLMALLTPWTSVWPQSWPFWAQLALAILLLDIGITLVHYVSHRINWLWRFHAVHHSVERMYGFNGLLKHPVHQTLEISGGAIPWIILGIPFEIAALAGFAASIQLLLQHSNVDMRIGPLKFVWAVAPVHRHHHIASASKGDVNFGLFLTLWDVLLGTANFAKSDSVKSGSIGIEDAPDYPTAYLPQLIQPFRNRL